jgi:small basic protein
MSLDQIAGWLPAVAFFLPLVIGLVSKATLPEQAKAVIMLVVTAVAALAAQVAEAGGILEPETFKAWLLALVVTIASYYGVWKPLCVGNIALAVGLRDR